MPFPRVPYGLGAKSNVTIALSGLNWTDAYSEGALEDSMNLTASRYPYFSTKAPREEMTEFAGATAMTAWNDIAYVKNNKLYYKVGDTYKNCGSVSEGEKQFVMLYKKMVVWPDKKYIKTDVSNPSLITMEASSSGAGAFIRARRLNGIDYMQLVIPYGEVEGHPEYDWGIDVRKVFRSRDVVTLSGFSNQQNNGEHYVEKVTEHSLLFAPDTLVDEGSADARIATDITVERTVPDMDFVCEYGNRLWGCSNSSQTIYCSRLDDPTNFSDYTGEADDSFAFDVSSPGDFTGCCKLASSVLFFKEQTLHKVLGSNGADFQMVAYTMHGIAEGCHKSAVVINETLFYVATDGVYAYNGGTASLISSELGEKEFKQAVSGTDGVNYYLSAYDGSEAVFLTYYGRYGLWLKEDNTRAVDIARVSDDVYVLTDDSKVYKENGSDATAAVEFLIQFKPFYETVTGSYRRSSVAFGHKRYGKLIVRTEMGPSSWAAFDIREDGGVWREVQKLVGETGLSRVVFPIGRADKYELRIRGNGQLVLKNMEREFRVGSDKR